MGSSWAGPCGEKRKEERAGLREREKRGLRGVGLRGDSAQGQARVLLFFSIFYLYSNL